MRPVLAATPAPLDPPVKGVATSMATVGIKPPTISLVIAVPGFRAWNCFICSRTPSLICLYV